MPAEIKKILLVESIPDISSFLETLCNDLGYETIKVKNLAEGRQHLGFHYPSLIILDIDNEINTGEDVINKFRSARDKYDIPIIILTASIDEYENRHNCKLKCPSASAVFEKPVRISELKKKINLLLA